MKKLIIILTVIGALVVGWYHWKNNKAATEQDTPEWITVKVERGPIRLVVASVGRVISNLDVDIKCKASVQLIALPYDVSYLVKKGDILV